MLFFRPAQRSGSLTTGHRSPRYLESIAVRAQVAGWAEPGINVLDDVGFVRVSQVNPLPRLLARRINCIPINAVCARRPRDRPTWGFLLVMTSPPV